MGKSQSTVKPKNKGVDTYPSFPPVADAMPADDHELPGNLPPMADGGGDPALVGPEYNEEDMPHHDDMASLVDHYTPTFQPSPTPDPPSIYPGMRPQRPMTKPTGALMSGYLYSRSRRPQQQSSGIGENAVNSGALITSQPEALKQAMTLIGLQSTNNPTGLNVTTDTAKQVFFGKKDIGEVDEAAFRAAMDSGDINIDKKKIRQFVNYDGSVTYEILNDDKSIMSRFTMGDFKGKKVFVQGGYAAYAQSLKDLSTKFQQMETGQSEFDKLRSLLGGGG